MPASLFDMFQPQDAAGQPTDFGGALQANTNSLVGLGMGLLQPRSLAHGAPVSSAWGDALQGYQAGSALDQRRGYQQAQLQHQKSQAARQAAMDRFNMGMRKREFDRAGESEFDKINADIEKYRGTPQEAAVRQYYETKLGGGPPPTSKIYDPNLGEEVTAQWNRATKQYEPAKLGGSATAPASVDPWTTGQGQPVYGAGGNYSAPSAAAPSQGPADLPPRMGPKAFEPEQKLRKEFEDTAKPYIVARQAFTKMQASQDNAAGDIALIFGYMKMLDPPSTVREGEFATAQNSGGIEDRIRNTYNKLLSGERLTPAQREQFKGQGAAVWDQYNKEFQPRIQQFRDIAKRYRIDPRNVIPDLGPDPVMPERRPPATPGTPRQDTQRVPTASGFSRPSNLPPKSAFSPSLGVWRSPEGVFFDRNGRRYPDQSQFQGQ